MSDNSAKLSPEFAQRMTLEYEEQRRILHNNLMQRILTLRDKLSSTASLTEISKRLNEIEVEIRGGCDLEEIDLEIMAIEKIVGKYLQSFLQFLIHAESEISESKTSQAIHHARDTNYAEKN
jgi:hypothetical protein